MVEPGQILDGKYRIVRLIGEGGMGAVFEGENTRISRRVAIKVLHGAALANPETVQRFEREAQAAGRIGNEHILEILDLGTLPDGERYMVMEFLLGETLSARIRRLERMTPEQIVPLIRQALVGLGAAHQAGIIHRDLKPDNLFVLRERTGIKDYVKIIDFGISKFSAIGGDMSMTRTGTMMGTPYYMSPEQAKGTGQVDQRSDLYAIGVILYEAVTGNVPFSATTFNELMFKIVLTEPTPLAQLLPDVNPRFAELVSRAMAREPAHRFSSAQELIEAIDMLGLPLGATAGGAPFQAGYQTSAERPDFALPAVTNPGQPTQGAFATSQQGSPGGSKKWIGLAAAAVLLLGGGAFAALGLRSKGHAADGPPSGAPAAAIAPETAPEVTSVKATAAPETAAPAVAPAPNPVVSGTAPSPAADTAAAKATAAKAPAVAGQPRRPASKPAPASKPTPASKPATPAKSSRDFGY